MNEQLILELSQNTLKVTAMVASPMLIGALVMACLATRAPYASLPGQYAIEAPDRLSFLPSSVAQLRCSETHSSSELAKLWPNFESVRSFLLRNGMQEIVLRRREQP